MMKHKAIYIAIGKFLKQNWQTFKPNNCRSSTTYRSNRQRLVAHSTAMESIQAESEPIDEEEDMP